MATRLLTDSSQKMRATGIDLLEQTLRDTNTISDGQVNAIMVCLRVSCRQGYQQ